MKVIFLKDVKNLGRKYEEREVSNGYALNYLIPNKLAVPATGAAAGQIKSLKDNEAKHKEADLRKLEAEIAKLSGAEVVVEMKANEKNHLFAALTADKLSDLLKKEKAIALDAEHIVLKEPIKQLGTFEIPVSISGKQTHFTLVVKSK